MGDKAKKKKRRNLRKLKRGKLHGNNTKQRLNPALSILYIKHTQCKIPIFIHTNADIFSNIKTVYSLLCMQIALMNVVLLTYIKAWRLRLVSLLPPLVDIIVNFLSVHRDATAVTDKYFTN